MGDEEVDGLLGAAVVVEVVVVAVDDLDEGARVAVALGEAAHGVAVAAVPLSPAAREVADLVAPQVPGLGDDLDVLLGGEIGDAGEQRGLVEEALEVAPVVGGGVGGHAAEHGGQVEAESVHAHVGAPVAQGVQDELAGHRGGVVDLVGGAGGAVDEDLVRRHLVVLGGGEAAQAGEADGVDVASPVAALGGVVVDDVEVDLDARGVEGVDHLGELPGGAAPALVRGVLAVGGEEGQGHVAPGVRLALAPGLRGVGLVDGQELDGGEAGRFEVGGEHAGALVGALELCGDVGDVLEAGLTGEEVAQARGGGVAGELLDAGLVDDGLLGGQVGLRGGGGVGGVLGQDDALGGVGGGVDLAARDAVDVVAAGAEDAVVDTVVGQAVGVDGVGDLAGVGVEEDLVGVESVALLVEVGDEAGGGAGRPGGVVGPVGAPGAPAEEGAGLEARDLGAPDAVLAARGQEGARCRRPEGLGVDLELEAGGGRGVDGDGHAVGAEVGSERPGGARPGGFVDRGGVCHGREPARRP